MSSNAAMEEAVGRSAKPFSFNERDKEYIRSNFITLDELSLKMDVPSQELLNLVRERQFPNPTYLFEDGTQWYPSNYVALMERARKTRKRFSDAFQDEIRAALLKLKERNYSAFRIVIEGESFRATGELESVVKKIWNDFQSGEYAPASRVRLVAR